MTNSKRSHNVLVILMVIFMVSWVIYLCITLPRTYEAQHWRMAWIGFDLALFVTLISTLRGFLKQKVVPIHFGFVSATLLFVDSWFDVVTSQKNERLLSFLMAIVIQIPVGVYLSKKANKQLLQKVKRY